MLPRVHVNPPKRSDLAVLQADSQPEAMRHKSAQSGGRDAVIQGLSEKKLSWASISASQVAYARKRLSSEVTERTRRRGGISTCVRGQRQSLQLCSRTGNEQVTCPGSRTAHPLTITRTHTYSTTRKERKRGRESDRERSMGKERMFLACQRYGSSRQCVVSLTFELIIYM